ncbi:MAG: L,D-transpeptidase family protein [Anaerolineae bacterium]
MANTVTHSRFGLQRFRGENPDEQARFRLEAGRLMVRQGDLDHARQLFWEAVQLDRGCAEAWLQLAWLTPDRQEREALVRQVLALEPGHLQAQAELARLQPPSALPRVRPTNPSRRWFWVLALLILAVGFLGIALLIVGPLESSLAWLLPTSIPTIPPTLTRTPEEIAVQFVPQLEAAVANGNWDRALEIVAIMRGVAPTSRQIQERAFRVYMLGGQALVQAGKAEQAQAQFDQAVTLKPDDVEARLWQQTSQLYRAGLTALQSGQWEAAIRSFTAVQERLPEYGDASARLAEAYQHHGQAALARNDWTAAIEALTQAYRLIPQDPNTVDLLSTAYRQRGISWEQRSKFEEARSDLEAALALHPDDAEAKAHLEKVMRELFPPKRIEIDISTQRFYAYEEGQLVYEFSTSTGLPGQDTATGRFHVLDKMPMAYSSIWNLKMPYWLGIYYVGNIENGIHALPIRSDGTVMWAGLLGQRASYGCVILSTEAAKIIYEWADIGTPVDIHY